MANQPSDFANPSTPDGAAPSRGTAVEDGPEGRLLLFFVAANVLARLATVTLNSGAYTDGVLQVTQASEPTALWPPLYGWLTSCLSWAMPTLFAGRTVSALAGALGVVPLWILARRAGGRRAAFFAALVYTLSPVSLRWSARMMTDSLFATLFWAALERWDAAERDPRRRDGMLAAAMLWTAAATMARYQGVLLLPLLGFTWLRALIGFFAARKSAGAPVTPLAFPWKTLLASLALLAAPVWVATQGIAHGQQFSERLGPTLASAVLVISLNGEAFLLLTPYFLTYPVALWVVVGMFRGGSASSRTLLAATLYVGLAVVLLQSAFSSFQERYMMPWYGLLWVWGGIGLATAQEWLRRRARLFSAALALTAVWSAGFALAVLVLQHHAFGDIAEAGKWLRSNAPKDARIFSTELYNARLGGTIIATNKIRFFSGREVTFLPPPGAAPTDLPPGSLVCLHSAYPYWGEEDIVRLYRGKRVFEADTEILPLFPDIMEAPGTAQNPLAWMHRYRRQHFWTSIWLIEGKREP